MLLIKSTNAACRAERLGPAADRGGRARRLAVRPPRRPPQLVGRRAVAAPLALPRRHLVAQVAERDDFRWGRAGAEPAPAQLAVAGARGAGHGRAAARAPLAVVCWWFVIMFSSLSPAPEEPDTDAPPLVRS